MNRAPNVSEASASTNQWRVLDVLQSSGLLFFAFAGRPVSARRRGGAEARDARPRRPGRPRNRRCCVAIALLVCRSRRTPGRSGSARSASSSATHVREPIGAPSSSPAATLPRAVKVVGLAGCVGPSRRRFRRAPSPWSSSFSWRAQSVAGLATRAPPALARFSRIATQPEFSVTSSHLPSEGDAHGTGRVRAV